MINALQNMDLLQTIKFSNGTHDESHLVPLTASDDQIPYTIYYMHDSVSTTSVLNEEDAKRSIIGEGI